MLVIVRVSVRESPQETVTEKEAGSKLIAGAGRAYPPMQKEVSASLFDTVNVVVLLPGEAGLKRRAAQPPS